MKVRNKRVNVPVTAEVHTAALILCARQGITQAELVERLILQAAGEAK